MRHWQPSTKLIRAENGTVYGMTGLSVLLQVWVQWYENGQDPATAPNTTHEESGNFCVFKDGTGFIYSVEVPYSRPLYAPFTLGSGRDVALAVLTYQRRLWGDVGMNAEHAVQIAIDLDPHSGGKVQCVPTPTKTELRVA